MGRGPRWNSSLDCLERALGGDVKLLAYRQFAVLHNLSKRGIMTEPNAGIRPVPKKSHWLFKILLASWHRRVFAGVAAMQPEDFRIRAIDKIAAPPAQSSPGERVFLTRDPLGPRGSAAPQV